MIPKPAAAVALDLEGFAVSALIMTVKVLGLALAIAALSLVGWAISSLPKLAGWTTDLATKLEIIRGMLSSVGAGAIVALLALYLDWPYVLVALVTFLAGILGDKFLLPFAERVIGRLTAAADVFLGRNGNGSNGKR